ncbi:MAG: GIY-YIG nuclease family protein [Planctomycetota bacterium]|jgi:Uri superfamily endonuclease
MTRLLPQRRIAGLPGTYALLLHCRRPARLRVGRLGVLRTLPGFYVYVGSALGPGGVEARVRRHERPSARPHWHIDYLRARADLVEVWHSYDARRREHQWASIVPELQGASMPLRGFGSSDCGCASHLFFFERRPLVRGFRGRLHRAVPGHAPVGRVSRPDICFKKPTPSSAA